MGGLIVWTVLEHEACLKLHGKHVAQNLRLLDHCQGLWQCKDAGAGSISNQSKHCFVSQVGVRVANLSALWLVQVGNCTFLLTYTSFWNSVIHAQDGWGGFGYDHAGANAMCAKHCCFHCCGVAGGLGRNNLRSAECVEVEDWELNQRNLSYCYIKSLNTS